MADGKRATEADIELRVEAVMRLILQGGTHYDICQFTAKNWGVSSRQTDRYIAEARGEIKAIVRPNREENLAEHLAIRRDLRNKAYKGGDYRLALDIAKDEAKLLDLYPADKQEITGKDGGPVPIQIVEVVRPTVASTDAE